jgi:hypothetical protein
VQRSKAGCAERDRTGHQPDCRCGGAGGPGVVPARAVEAAKDSLGTTLERSGAAWDALRGVPAERPAVARRWPWAVGAAVLGALVGGLVAAVLRRVGGGDAPGALDPEDVVAVVDRPVATPHVTPAPPVPPTAPDGPA